MDASVSVLRCPVCGAPVAQDANACRYCAAPIAVSRPAAPAASAPPTSAQPAPAPAPVVPVAAPSAAPTAPAAAPAAAAPAAPTPPGRYSDVIARVRAAAQGDPPTPSWLGSPARDAILQTGYLLALAVDVSRADREELANVLCDLGGVALDRETEAAVGRLEQAYRARGIEAAFEPIGRQLTSPRSRRAAFIVAAATAHAYASFDAAEEALEALAEALELEDGEALAARAQKAVDG